MAFPFLEATGLSKTYKGSFRRPDVKALENLTLSVHGGEIFGLLGPNGAGKTTFIKLVLGLVRPSSGSAKLMGKSVRDWRARRTIGYLPENHRFPEFLTARQMLALYGQLSGLEKKKVKGQINEVLDLVGMQKWADVQIRKYSKGMMQRVGLAQSLLGDPSVVFLDEPTDGVDPIGRREIRNVLIHLRDLGKTVFINSHLLSELEMVCSRVAIINRGQMVREGTLDNLLSQSGSFSIRTTPIPREILEENRSVVIASELVDDADSSVETKRSHADIRTYTLNSLSRSQLNEFIDLLRAANVEIEAVERSRDSLEDLFVRSIGTSPARDEAKGLQESEGGTS